MINGQRRHVRTIRFEAAEKQKVVEAILVFDYSTYLFVAEFFTVT